MTKALDYLLKAEMFTEYFHKGANAEARRLHQEAIKADGKFARAYSCYAYATLQAYLYNWWEKEPWEALQEMQRSAADSLGNDSSDYWNHWMEAAVLLYSKDFVGAKKRYKDVALMVASDAIPEDQRAFAVDHADMLLLTGNPKQAIDDINAVLKAGFPERWFHWVLAWAYYIDGQHQTSLDLLLNFSNPRNAIRKNVICNLVALNKESEAKAQAQIFIAEEAAQGISYGDGIGAPVLEKLLAVEDRVPFEHASVKNLWKERMTVAFKDILQT
jgi:hypothetical protein